MTKSIACTNGLNSFLIQFTLLISLVLCQSTCYGKSHKNVGQDTQVAGKQSNVSYICEWSYLQLNASFIAFTINHFSLIDRNNETDVQEISEAFTEGYGSIEETNFALTDIFLNATNDELRASRLDPNLPFLFFINGFNTFNQEGEVNRTWMIDVAKTYAGRGLQNRRNNIEPNIGANIIFLTWGIPHIYAESVLAMLPAYLKTIANYDFILEFVAETITKFIRFVEESRELNGGWKSKQEQEEYYQKCEFFGHSLGSHIVTDAISQVRKTFNNKLKLGKMMGLDPAMPCFMSLGHGASKDTLTNSTVELVVVHSNAGFAGLTAERANVEIVLNGGTFQPGCKWYDFGCHHGRSTAIFGYLDDRCQMVSYKCPSYHHFKSGACETCEFKPGRQSDTYGKNCVLVNLPEQHKDTNQTLEFVKQMDDEVVRQLADENDQFDLATYVLNNSLIQSSTILSPRSDSLIKLNERPFNNSISRQKPSERVYYHFVNTNANYRNGRKTHCLEHYQLRAIILQDDIRVQQNCPISSFIGDGIQLKLLHDDSLLDQQANGIGWRDTITGRSLKASPDIKLGKIIKDSLYTNLLNFEGSPELFIGAVVNNIKLDKFSECLSKQNASSGTNLVLDIAFMSHIDRKFRHSFSSILCGRIEPVRCQNETTYDQQCGDKLLLALCKQSELTNVSSQIDQMLDHIEQLRLDDSWTVSLLNSLFSLFTEWEPF